MPTRTSNQIISSFSSKIALAALASAALIAPIGSVQAQSANFGGAAFDPVQFYLAARGGVTNVEDSGFETAIPLATYENKHDQGKTGSLAAGLKFTPNMFGATYGTAASAFGYRAEAEVGRINAEVDEVSVGGTTYTGSDALGEVEATYGMANLYADYWFNPQFSAFAGAGVGFGKVDFQNLGVATPAGLGPVLNDDDTRFGYNGTVGLAFKVLPSVTLEGSYRYFDFGDAEVTAADGTMNDVSFASNQLGVGLRLEF